MTHQNIPFVHLGMEKRVLHLHVRSDQISKEVYMAKLMNLLPYTNISCKLIQVLPQEVSLLLILEQELLDKPELQWWQNPNKPT